MSLGKEKDRDIVIERERDRERERVRDVKGRVMMQLIQRSCHLAKVNESVAESDTI